MAQSNGSLPPAIRPEQVDRLPHLTQAQRDHYKKGLSQLWQALESSQPGTQQFIENENKIKQASMRLMQQMSNPQRPTSGGGQGQQQQQQRPAGQQGGAGQTGTPQGANMAQQGSQQGNGGRPQGNAITQAVQIELKKIVLHVPGHIASQGDAVATEYRRAWFKKAGEVLTKREQVKMKGLQAQAQLKSGQGDQQQAKAILDSMKAEMGKVVTEWEAMKQQNELAGGQAPNMQRQNSGGVSRQQQQMNNLPQLQAQGDAKMQIDPAMAQSPQPLQGGFQHSQQQAQAMQNQVGPSPVQAQPHNMPQQPNSAHPQSASQQQPPQNFPHNNMAPQQHPNQQQRQQMNAQQMQQVQQNMIGQQPQSATRQQPPPQQQQPQQPQPLSHQAAVSQAAEHYSRQQAQNQQQPQQTGPQMPNIPHGLPLNQPQSATQQTPTSAYPSSLQSGPSNTTNKFPIGKTLHLDPRLQQPVQGQPSRPTYANAGMMQQPGIQKQAQFTLEGEGDRVLSKRKLDELVRQVTGNVASSTDGASETHNALEPDVEEAILTYADDFVDNVITSACRLAKLRSSQTLDLRDIQMVLERNYGIRIPGYGLEEARTVRKFQPAPGWTNKMQAVQAAKVTNKIE